MPVFNYAGQEINAKIVYYGPGLSGKTTNLEFIYAKLPRENKGKMVSMKTRTDRTLFFDFLPIDIGEINGMKVRFLLYTVPGQVYYNATRKLVLKGVDAVVFVADSAPDRMADNKESLQNLEDNLNDLGMTLREMPWVLQFNKRDLPNALDREAMERELNEFGTPSFEAVANKGSGVYETFEGIAKLVLTSMQDTARDPDRSRDGRPARREEHLNIEVVAKGKREYSSEADGSDYRYSAEKREEEQKSVSEFVDSVLTESDPSAADSVDLGATRGGYESYGHIVELAGEENGSAAAAGPDTAAPEPPPKGEIVNADPLEGLKASPPGASGPPSKSEPPPAAAKPAVAAVAAQRAERVQVKVREDGGRGAPQSRVDVIEEKTIRVPIRLSRADTAKEIQISVLLDIEVE